MIDVSVGWVNAHQETLLPEMFVELTYGATEPGLQQDASSTANGETTFSEVETIVNGEDKTPERYATLEHGHFGLDGNYTYFDGTPVDPGYVSNVLSDGEGVFATIPTISIGFATQHTVLVPGITITWSETFSEWASEFRVTALNAGVVVNQTTITGNTSPVTPVWMDLSGYNQIKIEVLKWSHPYHRARSIEVYLGIKTVYTKNDLIGFDHTQTADLLSAALPKNAITFRLRNEDKRWNPDNPAGSERYLMEQQEVKLRYGMDVDGRVEWIKGGTFWLSEWSTPSNGMEASFTARDAIGLMNVSYTGVKTGTLYAIATAALAQAKLPVLEDGSERYIVSDTLKKYTTDLSDDRTDYTIEQILQLVAHAGCCVFFQDRDGVVRIEPWVDRYSGYMIEPKISFTHPEYTMNKPLRAVTVSYGDNQSATVTHGVSGEVQTVSNAMLRTEADALRVAEWTEKLLENRKVISGEFRADVRMDVMDNIIVTSKYASNIIAVTEVTYSTTGGAFRGKYTGRVVSIDLKPSDRRSGEFYSGEV